MKDKEQLTPEEISAFLADSNMNESEVVEHKQIVNGADVLEDNNDITKKFEDAKIDENQESVTINGINFVDKKVIMRYNLKVGLSKKHPRERLATVHRKITRELIKLQKEQELKAKAEEIKY